MQDMKEFQVFKELRYVDSTFLFGVCNFFVLKENTIVWFDYCG